MHSWADTIAPSPKISGDVCQVDIPRTQLSQSQNLEIPNGVHQRPDPDHNVIDHDRKRTSSMSCSAMLPRLLPTWAMVCPP